MIVNNKSNNNYKFNDFNFVIIQVVSFVLNIIFTCHFEMHSSLRLL